MAETEKGRGLLGTDAPALVLVSVSVNAIMCAIVFVYLDHHHARFGMVGV